MIRAFQPADTDAVINIWFAASSLAHPFLSPEFMEQEKKNIRELYLPNTETWIYEKEQQAIGFLSMMGNEVGAIFLYPAYHGQGIGKALMDWVAQKHPTLEVEVFKENTIGRAFYDRYGFRVLKEHVHEPTGRVLLRMGYGNN